MPESHERILRRIIRRFDSIPTNTYSNGISNDVNVRITYEERPGRVLNLNKTCAKLIRRVPIRRRTLANIRSCDRGIRPNKKRMWPNIWDMHVMWDPGSRLGGYDTRATEFLIISHHDSIIVECSLSGCRVRSN